MAHMACWLLLWQATSCLSISPNLMSLFVRDLAKHYEPTPLTVVYNEREEHIHVLEGGICSTSTVYCLGYAEENSLLGIIEYFSDQTVLIVITTSEIGMTRSTILKDGKQIFLPLSEGGKIPPLRLDNNVIFYKQESSRNEERVLLSDKYNPSDGVLFTHSVGTWTPDSGLNLTKSSRWGWRDNLYGKQLRVGVLKWPPFFDYKLDQNGLVFAPKGLLFDILQQLAKNLNFTTIMVTPKDGQWGSMTENGEYTGLIGDLVSMETDIAPSGLYLVKWREEVVDFTLPVLEDLQTFIALESNGKLMDYTVYINIFMPDTWVMVCISFAMMSFILHFLRHVSLQKQAYSVGEFLSSIAASGRQLIQLPQELGYFNHIGARMTLLVFAIYSYVLYTLYTSDLTAAMTSTAPSLGISSFEDAKRDGYKVLVIDGTTHSERVKDKGMNLVMLKPTPGVSYPELLAQTMYKESSKVLNFGSSLSFVGKKEFYPLIIRESLTQLVAFALQQDSEYRELFNHQLKKLDEKGILYKMAKTYIPKRNNHGTIMEAIPLGWYNVWFPSLIVFLGISASMLFACVEKIKSSIEKSEKPQKRVMAWVTQVEPKYREGLRKCRYVFKRFLQCVHSFIHLLFSVAWACRHIR